MIVAIVLGVAGVAAFAVGVGMLRSLAPQTNRQRAVEDDLQMSWIAAHENDLRRRQLEALTDANAVDRAMPYSDWCPPKGISRPDRQQETETPT